MTAPAASVVVVSRNRPDDLTLCLTALSQLQRAWFEIVVVADPAGLAAARGLPFADHLKLVGFDKPNVSAARNVGLSHAAGEIVAFIDDDAVAEPSWLRFLTDAFADDRVCAATGFVRGRNGISYQWRARTVDGLGDTRPLDVGRDTVTVLTPPGDPAIKVEGTNMAFRRATLVRHGGFDEAYRYYLDETDMSLRLAREGCATAIVPMAEVQHRMAANRVRTRDRTPHDLHDIGASWAVLQRKHVPAEGRRAQWAAICASERSRLLRHMVAGSLEPGDVGRLLRRLRDGHADGLTRLTGAGPVPAQPLSAFRPFPVRDRPARVVAGRIWSRRRLRDEARRRVAEGENVTLIELSPTALYHHAGYLPDGYWLQVGGLFGRSDRDQPLAAWHSHHGRVALEAARADRVRTP